jgi:hypothetical protein
MQNDKTWPIPQIRGVGFFSDSSIYLEVLKYGLEVEYFTKSDLMGILSNRVKGLLYSKSISKTAINNLLVELKEFRWIEYFLAKNYHTIDSTIFNEKEVYGISELGISVYQTSLSDKDFFDDTIISQLNKIYSTPGWFVQRLWDLNPDGQGQIIIPSPPKIWNPNRRSWNDNQWSIELNKIVAETYVKIKSVLPTAFPIGLEELCDATEERWVAIGNSKPRKDAALKEKKNEFTPRKRLALAMREAVIKKWFQNKNPKTLKDDFEAKNDPLHSRTYSYWCSKLEELGLINYTDYNSRIPGRLIYPISTYNSTSNKPEFYRVILDVKNLEKKPLLIFKPTFDDDNIRNIFIETLFEEYSRINRKTKSLYISSQDLRDEVCRVLKFSSYLFDLFLEQTVNFSANGNIKYRISLETDIREDQQSRSQMQRKPVYFNKRIISLIAITYAK